MIKLFTFKDLLLGSIKASGSPKVAGPNVINNLIICAITYYNTLEGTGEEYFHVYCTLLKKVKTFCNEPSQNIGFDLFKRV